MRLTVIIPVYNVESYIEECISSILCQTESFDEIILVNDGSTDGSGEICERYCTRYPIITLISQENQGLAAARNAGLSQAAGDYVIFVDSDDYIETDMVQKLKEYLCLQEIDILYYSASMQYDIPTSEKAMTHLPELDYRRMTGKTYLYKAFPESYSSSACLAAYRTKFLKDNNLSFPEKTYFEDNLFSLRAALAAECICCVPDRFYIRRCRAESIMTGEVSKKKCMDTFSVQCSLWECLKDKKTDTDCVDFTCRFILAGMLHAVGYLKQASDEMYGKKQIRKLIYSFFEAWMSLITVKKLSFDQAAALLIILHETDMWAKEEQMKFICRFWGAQEKYWIMRQEFEEQIRAGTTDRMKKLPFYKKSCRAGVYGIGRHTQAVLNLYQTLVGEIQCDLYFIVTVKDSSEFLKRPVFAVSDCKEIVDEIVISSRLYQQEMRENLMNEGIDENRVISLYQQGDICDYIAIEELFAEIGRTV